ncbi:MAG: S41 family peptidase [Acidobacteriota bacterium]|nr:S41 family peptidase [Acidobacteriota bacterium]
MSSTRSALRSRLIFMAFSVACLAPFATGALIGADAGGEDSLFKELSVLSEVLTLIQRTYVDETSIGDLLAGALEGATDALDPLSTFVPAEHAATYAETLRVGSSVSGLVVAKDRGIAYVVAAVDGGPAAAQGVRPGDVIAAVDGASTRAMPLWRLQGVLAGPPGTELALELLRNGQEVRARLTLERFAPPPPSLSRSEGVAVLRIPRFDDAVAGEARDLVAPLRGTEERLIVDLRGTAGGRPEAAYELARLFTTGRLGSLRARDEELGAFDSDLPPLWEGEIAVVVDGGTQGPAEILATVLKQAAAAILVGEPTFGLAGRQGFVDLPSGGRVVMIDAYFAGPDGLPIDHRIRPDEVVRKSFSAVQDDDAERGDPLLERAVEMLERAAAKAA